jgi:uncharacterized membrane protein
MPNYAMRKAVPIMVKNPVLDVPKTSTERLHDTVALVVILASLAYFIWQWTALPATVPIHFNARGEADGWGSKTVLLLLPTLMLVLYIGLSLLRKIPHHFNYLKPITEANAVYQYRTSIQMLSWLKLEIVLLFGYIQWSLIRNAEGLASGIGIWLLPATLVIIFGTIIYYIIKLAK